MGILDSASRTCQTMKAAFILALLLIGLGSLGKHGTAAKTIRFGSSYTKYLTIPSAKSKQLCFKKCKQEYKNINKNVVDKVIPIRGIARWNRIARTCECELQYRMPYPW